MKDKELLRVKRYIELEEYLIEKSDNLMETSQSIEIISVDFSDKEDLEYLSFALKMPFKEVKKVLDYYDSFTFLNKPDEIQIINELIEKFNVTYEEVIVRIKQIRKISYFKNINVKKRKRKRNKR